MTPGQSPWERVVPRELTDFPSRSHLAPNPLPRHPLGHTGAPLGHASRLRNGERFQEPPLSWGPGPGSPAQFLIGQSKGCGPQAPEAQCVTLLGWTPVSGGLQKGDGFSHSQEKSQVGRHQEGQPQATTATQRHSSSVLEWLFDGEYSHRGRSPGRHTQPESSRLRQMSPGLRSPVRPRDSSSCQ